MKVIINNTEYPLNWNLGALLRHQKLKAESDTELMTGLKFLYAMLPAGSFESIEDLADHIEIEETEALFASVEAVVKKKMTTQKS